MIGVFSCQKEDDSFIKQEHTSQTSKTKYSITKIDYQTVQQNNRLVNSITKIKEQTGTKGSSTQNRLVHSSAYGFYIDTDVATYMENANGSYHSYTFPIFRDNPTIALENLLFSLQEDGTYKVSIVSYDITESEREALLNRQYIDLTNKIAKEDIDGLELVDDVFNKEVQTSFTWSYVCECDISEHIGGVDPNTGNLCNCVGIQISITNGTGENKDGNNPGGFPDNNENPHEYPDNSDVPDGENNPGGGVPDSPTTTEEEATTPVVTIPYAQNLIDCFGLDDYENANLDVSEWIYESDNFFQMRDVSSYVDRNNCSTEAQSFAMEAIEAMLEGEVDSLQEYISFELQNELLESPFKLVEIDCDQIEQWQVLAQFSPPQIIIDKLNQIDENLLGGVSVQTIENAEGAVVNLDYFPIIVDILPNNPSTGVQFSADEFLEYIRKEINTFINNDFTEFIPSPITGFDEESIWLSNNPQGAIMSLDIPGAHDGSVVCSENTNSHWVFTTLTMPWGIPQGLDGPHPVSGNRQIGYEMNSNGTYTFYARGVDRMESNFDVGIANYMTGGNPFNGADALWNSFQEKVQNFTNDNGGVGNATSITVNRPEWDKVKNVLLGNRPISDLGCE
jgi:hypothetical protein